MKKIILFIFLFIAVKLFSQSLPVEDSYWESSQILDVIKFEKATFCSVNLTENSLKIKKFDTNFNILKQISVDYSGKKPANIKIFYFDKSFYVFGTIYQNTTIQYNLQTNSYADIFVIKLDDNLNFVESHTLGFNFITPEYYLFRLDKNFVVSMPTSAGGSEIWFLKENFEKKLFTTRDYVVTDTKEIDNNYYSCGYKKTGNNKQIVLSAGAKYFDGEHQIIFGTKEIFPLKIVPQKDELTGQYTGFVLAGYYTDNFSIGDLFIQKRLSNKAIFFISFDLKLKSENYTAIESWSDVFLYDIKEYNGNLFVTGTFKGEIFSFDKIIKNLGKGQYSFYDVFFVKYDKNFNVLLSSTVTGMQDDFLPKIFVEKENIFLTQNFKYKIKINATDTIGQFTEGYNSAWFKFAECSQNKRLFETKQKEVADFPFYLTTSKKYKEYYWNTEQKSQGINIYQQGKYCVNVVDYYGCRYSDSIFIVNKNKAVLQEQDNNLLNANIYPNPAYEPDIMLQIETGSPQNVKIAVYTIAGIKIVSKEIFTGNNKINYQINLPENYTGIFFVEVITKDKNIKLKGVKL